MTAYAMHIEKKGSLGTDATSRYKNSFNLISISYF